MGYWWNGKLKDKDKVAIRVKSAAAGMQSLGAAAEEPRLKFFDLSVGFFFYQDFVELAYQVFHTGQDGCCFSGPVVVAQKYYSRLQRLISLRCQFKRPVHIRLFLAPSGLTAAMPSFELAGKTDWCGLQTFCSTP